ncbi:hypothetical protein TNCV_927671 [Trichonephila clavipes]|nr:hypothetical protein TNCV_927671 [Trichonephila clavipes]
MFFNVWTVEQNSFDKVIEKDTVTLCIQQRKLYELRKKVGERKRVDLTVSCKKKKTQLCISAENSAAASKNFMTVPEHSAVPENSTAVPEKLFLPPRERNRERVIFKKHVKLLIFPITIVHWG